MATPGVPSRSNSLEPLPSLPTYLWSAPATVPVHVFAIAVPDRLRVGYISADNDAAIPDSLRRLGVDVEMLDANALAFGDLSRYDPDGLFFGHHGVGSEDWSEDGFTRLY